MRVQHAKVGSRKGYFPSEHVIRGWVGFFHGESDGVGDCFVTEDLDP
jgi:hypothetical protein